jgi:hypothetical protein
MCLDMVSIETLNLDSLKNNVLTAEKLLTVWKTTSWRVKKSRSRLVVTVETPRLSKKSLIILKTFSWFILLFWSLTTINKSMKSCLLHGKVDYVHMLYDLKIGQLFFICIHVFTNHRNLYYFSNTKSISCVNFIKVSQIKCFFTDYPIFRKSY